MPSIVLASGSRYRAELLKKLHLQFTVCSSDVDENRLSAESAEQLASRLSQAKALAIAAKFPAHLIIGSDQVAVCNGRFLHKPGDRKQAIAQLEWQSGQAVQFYTGLCVFNSANQQVFADMDVTTVFFRALSRRQIERYVDLEQPWDCAGSFKSEGLGIALFSRMETSDPNALIGLPLIKLVALLARNGVDVLGDTAEVLA
jgi:septum formation protein